MDWDYTVWRADTFCTSLENVFPKIAYDFLILYANTFPKISPGINA